VRNKILISVFTIFLFSCNAARNDKTISGVEAAMKQYDHLIQKMDADSIALLYAPDGRLGNMAVGRDSIKKFLSSFKNVEVLSQASTTKFISLINDTAIQKGTYQQTDVLSKEDTVIVKGEYTARWEWLKDEGWHIKSMETKPAN
jgi:hypothetical protein